MTTSYLSISEFTGDGVTTEWNFNFAGGYISRDHVFAYTQSADGVVTHHELTFVSDFRVVVTPAVPVGDTLRIYRNTPREEPIVNFTGGSNFTEANLDLLARQTVFVAAEAFDAGSYAYVNDLLAAATNAQSESAASALEALAAAEDSHAAATEAATQAAELVAPALAAKFASMMNPRGEWAIATAYSSSGAGGVRDTFVKDGVAYVVVQDHTSGVFADDLAAGRFFENDAASLGVDLLSSSGASRVNYVASSLGAMPRTVESKLRDNVNVRDFGAICDGVARPLSTLYATLAAAQVDFPSATALTDYLDSVAIQKCFDSIADGTKVEMRGTARSNKTLYINKSYVEVDARGCVLKVSPGVRYSLVVHGAPLDRTLTGTDWYLQFLTQPYETATVSRGAKVHGLSVESATGGRLATQVCFYFADDCEADISVNDSDGNGVEFRHCANPRFSKITLDNIANYGLFVYQCYGLVGGVLKVSRSGRVYAIKQRHKLYSDANHRIGQVIAEDCFGFGDPAWAAIGGAFNDLVRGGYTAAVTDNRNFPGHEILRGLKIDQHDFVVTSAAGVSVVAPSVHIGAYSDKVDFGQINLDANGKAITTTPLIIGGRGDIAEGIAGGATFGKDHIIDCVSFSGFNSPDANGLISYAVDSSVRRVRLKSSTVRIIAEQSQFALLPFGTVGAFELRNLVGDVNLKLGAVGTRGVQIGPETQLFVSGGTRLNVTPVNSGAEDTFNAWRVRAATWQVIGRDEITMVNGGLASNHTSTYLFRSDATAGQVAVKASCFAPTLVRALSMSNTVSTKALVLNPSEFVLTGSAPSGENTAISTAGEVNLIGGNTFTGAWANTVSDTSGLKNSGQNIRRRVFLAAAPTSGTWSTGDVAENPAPYQLTPIASWRCSGGGTPGNWVASSWLVFRGTTAARPTLLASGVGVQYLDTTLAAAGKLITWTGTQWVDATGAVV